MREETEECLNVLFHRNGNASGLTPLLDKDGKPVVSAELSHK